MGRIKYQEAAGLVARRGRPPAGPAPSEEDLVRLYVKEGQSVRDVAAALGCSKDMVYRRLRGYAIKTRAGARRGSALLKYPLSDLRAMVKEKGIRSSARELGVNPSTLLHHLSMRLKKGKK